MKKECKEALDKEYLVEGHVKDMAILTDEWGNIYFTKGTKEELPVGCVSGSYDLHSIFDLSKEDQKEIRAFLYGPEGIC